MKLGKILQERTTCYQMCSLNANKKSAGFQTLPFMQVL